MLQINEERKRKKEKERKKEGSFLLENLFSNISGSFILYSPYIQYSTEKSKEGVKKFFLEKVLCRHGPTKDEEKFEIEHRFRVIS